MDKKDYPSISQLHNYPKKQPRAIYLLTLSQYTFIINVNTLWVRDGFSSF